MPAFTSLFKSKTAQEFARKAREEGRAEGRQQAREEGEAHGRATYLLDLLRRRGVDVPEHRAEQILTCHDLPQVKRWWNRAFEVDDIEQLFLETAE